MTAPFDPNAARPRTQDPPVRLSLTPEGATPGRLDGAWWPYSHDLLRELPPLAAELDSKWGRITRVTVNPKHWPVIPKRVPVAGHVIHVGWFDQEQDADEVMVCSFVPLRVELLVIPPEADAAIAQKLMTMAADPANTHTGTDMLTAAGVATAGEAIS